MARPRKSRSIEGWPSPVVYIPSGYTDKQVPPVEVAIEDFEVMRLVDGHAHSIEEASAKVGVARSTAGRMLERARRSIAIGIEQRAPVFLDAAESSVLKPPELIVPEIDSVLSGSRETTLAVAMQEEGGDTEISRIFGRAPCFAITREGMDPEYFDNPGNRIKRNAANMAVKLLQEHGVNQVVAGRYGVEALKALGKAHVQPFVAIGITLNEAVEIFK